MYKYIINSINNDRAAMIYVWIRCFICELTLVKNNSINICIVENIIIALFIPK